MAMQDSLQNYKGHSYNTSSATTASVSGRSDDEMILSYEPLNPDERQRVEGMPVGLKNIGNSKISLFINLACYFNCLIQPYFFLPNITQKILSAYKDDQKLQEQLKLIDKKYPSDEVARKRTRNSYILVNNMAKLYSQMLLANRKYVDPTQVLKSLVDDFGNPILVGE